MYSQWDVYGLAACGQMGANQFVTEENVDKSAACEQGNKNKNISEKLCSVMRQFVVEYMFVDFSKTRSLWVVTVGDQIKQLSRTHNTVP
jgi:hypothetical protein